jgi:hypothetical protein
VAVASLGFLAPGHLAAQEARAGPPDPDTSVTVRGRVVDHATDEPVPSAAVSLAAGPHGTRGLGTRVTDEEGRFLFQDVTPGTYRLRVTMLGYHAMADTLQVPSEGDLELLLPLSTDPIRLEPIVVTAERVPWFMRDLERRRLSRSGFFLTREEIEDRHPRHITDLLVTVPGGRIAPAPPYGYTLLLRGGCRPGVWLDRVRLTSPGSLDQLISPSNVEAIEVYHALELPAEFGSHPCGGVLIWTRVGELPPPGSGSSGGFLRKMGIAAGLLLLMFFAAR